MIDAHDRVPARVVRLVLDEKTDIFDGRGIDKRDNHIELANLAAGYLAGELLR